MSASTKDIILDAAEKLFAQHGFAPTSLRAIIKEAGVNTAAIHYHFGSKEELVRAVIARRAEGMNEDRLARLDRLEAAHPEGPLPVDDVVEAFFAPVVLGLEAREDADMFRRLIGRVAMEVGGELREVIVPIFAEVARRFSAALSRALPDAAPEDIFWKIHFMVGAMCFALSVPAGHKCPARDGAPEASGTELLARLVGFSAAGLAAPEARPTRKDVP